MKAAALAVLINKRCCAIGLSSGDTASFSKIIKRSRCKCCHLFATRENYVLVISDTDYFLPTNRGIADENGISIHFY